MKKELTLDTFGEIMDKFIKDSKIQLLIEMPEGTNDATVTDNAGLGPVVQFYIILNAVQAIYADMLKLMRTDDEDGKLLESLLQLLEESIREGR